MVVYHKFRICFSKGFILLLLIVGIYGSTVAAGPLPKSGMKINIRSCVDSTNWEDVTSIKELWRVYPDRIRLLINKLDLSRPGLKAAKREVQQGDTIQAAAEIIAYFKAKNNPFAQTYLNPDSRKNKILEKANNILQDSIYIEGNPVHIPRHADGGWKWNYKGPKNKDEFGYDLNRHDFLLTLLKAWKITHDPSYAQAFDRLIRDWTIHNPLPKKGSKRGHLIYKTLRVPTKMLDWRDFGEVIWRPLEVGIRMGEVWPQVFYGFQQSEEFTPAARLLMLSSIAVQADYLAKYHTEHHNHAIFELVGLARVGLSFPEFKKTDEWFNEARKDMLSVMKWIVYPDGISKEISTGYHIAVLKLFKEFKSLLKRASINVGTSYKQTLERMYNYVAYSMQPNGRIPLNGDSDLQNVRSLILKGGKHFQRADWRWIATNGKAGSRPRTLSKTFPWAGINIIRDGWSKKAQWSYFDTGPYGTAHQHRDKLHLSVAAYGRRLLVDGGRYTYENYFSFDPKTWRGYFRSSFSHNVIIIDGGGQNAGQYIASKPMRAEEDYVNKDEFYYVRGAFTKGFHDVKGKAIHTRAVLYKRGDYWIVVDHIKTDHPRKVKALWHYAPTCDVKIDGIETVSTDAGKGNLRIIPSNNLSWQVNLVKGQVKPIKQGWFSPEMGTKLPNYVAVYTAKVKKSTSFVWLLVPAKGKVPSLDIKLLKVNKQGVKLSITQSNRQEATIAYIPLKRGVKPFLENRK